jgi:hypothetical protein
MIRIKDHKQLEMFDPWQFLSPKRRRMLDEGWPGLFRNQLLCELPVTEICSFFREDFGRPSKELYTVLGVLLLQQTMDLCDEETIEQLAFNIQWHYALNITEESDSAKYISEKTLWSMRQRLTEHDLDRLMLDKITDKLAVVFKVNTDKQRIDSMHIRSNMRRLGRVSIFSQTISKFLVNLKRHHRNLFDTVSPQIRDRYMGQKALTAFSLVKPSEAEKTLQMVSSDLFDLIEQFKDAPKVCDMHSYKLMKRLLNEQCNVDRSNGGPKVKVKAPKQVPSNSLQNPSDPDATYSGHKGQGYQVQIMETFTETENKKEKDTTLNLVTHVCVQQACEHDSEAIMPAIKDTQRRGLAPSTLLSDTLYGGDDNVGAAKVQRVELIAPTYKGGNPNRLSLSDFKFDDNGQATACPCGHTPDKTKYSQKTDRHSAYFDLNHCRQCPHVEHCPVEAGKKQFYLRYSAKDHRIAVRRAMETSEEFIKAYRWRAGIEATMSQYDRLTGVKRLRVRGFEAVRYCATLKAAGLNLLRAAAVRRARLRAQQGRTSPFFMPFPIIKEHIANLVLGLDRLINVQPSWLASYYKLAA